MSQVWVNQKFLDSTHPKADKWKPDPPKEKKVWGTCPDCGSVIYEMTSYWNMPNGFVCIDCYLPYYEQEIGFHDCAGLDFGVALEG